MYSSNIPRCQHIKVNGTQCGSPAVRDRRFCFFHKKWHDQRIVINSAQARQSPPTLDLPVLEDANSIQVALMQVMRLLISHQIDHKTAGLLLYALQTASFNLRRTDFEPVVKTKIVIDPTRVDETPLGEAQWQNGDFENPEEPDEEEEEEAKNGHLEIQAMADPRARSDRRLACPARQRRSRRSPRLHSCLEFGSPLKGHNFIGSALKRHDLIGSALKRHDFIGSALKGHDFSRAVRPLKSSALAAAGSQLGKGTTFSRAAQGWRGPASAAGVCSVESATPDII